MTERKTELRNITNGTALCRRVLIYLLGIVVLAFGITLNTKTSLGVSPIISVAYCVSNISGIGLGAVTFVWYMIMILAQILLLRKDFKPWQLLQVGASVFTSWFIDLFDKILPAAESIPARVLMLAAAIVITSFGIILTVGMEIVPNPADGLANTLALKLGKNLGFGKNLFDFSSIVISVTMGLVVRGHLIGIGIGTICTMILTGRVVAFISRWTLQPCRKVVEASRGKADLGAADGCKQE